MSFRGPCAKFALVSMLAAILVEPVAADSMRCGQKVVRDGDSPTRLLNSCGEPGYKGRGYAEVRTPEGRKKVRVEQWHYKRGERSLGRVVLIYQGEIIGVETTGR